MGLGNEGSGIVTQVGKEVTHVKEGDHVITTWVSRIPISGLPVSKPTGATLHGRPVIADGDVYTWSEHMVTFAEKVILLYQRHYCGSLGATEPETDFPLFLEWVREDKFPLGKLVTNRYSLEQIEEARVALEEGQILGRAIIEI